MKKRTYQPKTFYLYADETGVQYLPDDKELFEKIDELPEGIETFEFQIRVLPASFSINSNRSLADVMLDAQLTDKQDNRRAVHKHQDLAMQELVAAIASWSYTDDQGRAIPVTEQAIIELEPGWIYDCLTAAHRMVNSAKNSKRG